MDILKTAVEWAKAEVFSSLFFVIGGTLFVLASVGFWQMGKTEISKSFIVPTMVAGALLLTVGLGLFFLNKTRNTGFPESYHNNAENFVSSELQRTDKSMAEYQTVVFKVIPILVAIAALLIVLIDRPTWRASSITFIAFLSIIMLIDSNAYARLKTYNKELKKHQIKIDTNETF